MTHNPLIMYAVADRLGQEEGSWRPFHWVPLKIRQRLQRARTAIN
jgi:hypothetical protein